MQAIIQPFKKITLYLEHKPPLFCFSLYGEKSVHVPLEFSSPSYATVVSHITRGKAIIPLTLFTSFRDLGLRHLLKVIYIVEPAKLSAT